MADRTKRLKEAIPEVVKALEEQGIRNDKLTSTFTNLRRGINDVKRTPEQLDGVASNRKEVWEFLLVLFDKDPKYGKQILSCAWTLLDSAPWAEAFIEVEDKKRFALWNISAGKVADSNPVDVAVKFLDKGVQPDDIFPQAAARCEFGKDFAKRFDEAPPTVQRSVQTSQFGAMLALSNRKSLAVNQQEPVEEEESPQGGGGGSPPRKSTTAVTEGGDDDDNVVTQAAEAAAALQMERLQKKKEQNKRRASMTGEGDGAAALGARRMESFVVGGAGGAGEFSPVTQRDIVLRLFESAMDALEVARDCLEPMTARLQQNIADTALQRVKLFYQRLNELQTSVLVMGPAGAGKTSVTHALVGFPSLPAISPSALPVEFVHAPDLVLPRLSIHEELLTKLQQWEGALLEKDAAFDDLETPTAAEQHAMAAIANDRQQAKSKGGRVSIFAGAASGHSVSREELRPRLCGVVTGFAQIAATLEYVQRVVYEGRTRGVISSSDLRVLCTHAEWSCKVEMQFESLKGVSEDVTGAGSLRVVDMISPDPAVWENSELVQMFRAQLAKAEGVLLCVDASVPRSGVEFGSMISDFLKNQSASLSKEDVFVIANKIDRLDGFYSADGLQKISDSVRKQQFQIFEASLDDEDNIIPAGASISLLGIYGAERVTKDLSPKVIGDLNGEAWFAALNAFLHGIHWNRVVKSMTLKRWTSHMMDMRTIGQINSGLAEVLLQQPFEKVLPRSIVKCMSMLKDVIEEFLRNLEFLEKGPGAAGAVLDTSLLRKIFVAFSGDLVKKVKDTERDAEVPSADAVHAHADRAMKEMAAQQGHGGHSVRFSEENAGDGIAELKEFLKTMSKDAIQEWGKFYIQFAEDVYEKAIRSQEKWVRSVNHHLKSSGCDAVMQKRALTKLQELHLPRPPALEIPVDKWTQLVEAHCAQVPYSKNKRLFQRTLKTYEVTSVSGREFMTNVLDLWLSCFRAMDLAAFFTKPIRDNLEEMIGTLEDLQHQGANLAALSHAAPDPQGAGRKSVVQVGGEVFDFTFAESLREVLPLIANFDTEDPEKVDAGELEQCEAVTKQVAAAVFAIRKDIVQGRGG
uniref:Uncharacterized protein n=1 Tax=Chromera velia CCMP2878 TaxID=1169474 RepID=A0A0G4HBQ5_9ALVE|eukprot:Cvel_25913.t1-p1 / transcript=Cvel_25913.t1 / gene=Cvel_25913 / organism=Chromera_velia_CCMP2878 / gene_product=hypothetical protein / transcript_product=hypothetical protein / location=Cvel_scaffold2995:1173-15574(+) / protein_length=1085 / sequence_SO=supercontig / SO=protein_coding / is_pseudo=false